MGSHTRYPNTTILAILNCDVAIKGERNILSKKIINSILPQFYIIPLYQLCNNGPGNNFLNFSNNETSDENQIGLYYVGYQNGTILAILNLHVPLMLPIIFQHNPT